MLLRSQSHHSSSHIDPIHPAPAPLAFSLPSSLSSSPFYGTERLPSALASFVFNCLMSSWSGHKVDSSGNKILDRAWDKLQGPGPPAHVVVHHLALLISLPVSPLDAEEDVPQGRTEVLHLEQILLKLLHLCRCEPKPNPGGGALQSPLNNSLLLLISPPGRIFSYCVRARAYTHVLARVYSTRASTCTIYTC